MNLIESSELWYLNADNGGPNAHDILGLSKTRIDAMALQNVSSRQIADYLTEKISIQNAKAKLFHAMKGEKNLFAKRTFDQSIQQIHARMKDHIRSRYEQPMISDEQFEEVFLNSVAEDEIEKVLDEALNGKREERFEIFV